MKKIKWFLIKMLINEIVYHSAHLFRFFYCLLSNFTSISSESFKSNVGGRGTRLLTVKYWFNIFNSNMMFKLAMKASVLFKLRQVLSLE